MEDTKGSVAPFHRLYKLWTLVKFMLPILATRMITRVAEMAMFTSLGNNPNTMSILAQFGIAYSLLMVALAFVVPFLDVSLVCFHTREETKKGVIPLILIVTCLLLLMFLLCYTTPGGWVLIHVFRLDEENILGTQGILLKLIPVIALVAFSQAISGIAIREGHVLFITVNKILESLLMIGSILVLQIPELHIDPLAVPIVGMYFGYVTSAAITAVYFGKRILPFMKPSDNNTDHSVLKLFRLYLTFVMLFFAYQSQYPLAKALMTMSDKPSIQDKSDAIALTSACLSILKIYAYPCSSVKDTILAFALKRDLDTRLHEMESTDVTKEDDPEYSNFDFRLLAVFTSISFTILYFPLFLESVDALLFVNVMGIPACELTQTLAYTMRILYVIVVLIPLKYYIRCLHVIRGHSVRVLPSVVIKLIATAAVTSMLGGTSLHGSVQMAWGVTAGSLAELVTLIITWMISELLWRRKSVVKNTNSSISYKSLRSTDSDEE